MSKQDYDNTNRGVLFKAKEKKTDKSPDYTGTINVEGVEMKLSGWLKTSGAGEKFFSLSVWTPTGGSTSSPKPMKPKQADPDDEIPF